MRIDGIVWQKNKMSNISGFLTAEDGSIFFTKYRDGYEDHAKVMFTRKEAKTNRMIDGLIGKMKPEEELFRVNKADVADLNIMKMDPVTAGGRTFYSVYVTFKANGTDYALTHSPNSEEETDELGNLFNV